MGFTYLSLVCFQVCSSVDINWLTPFNVCIFRIADLCPTNGSVLLFVVGFYSEDLYNNGRGPSDMIELITELNKFPDSTIGTLCYGCLMICWCRRLISRLGQSKLIISCVLEQSSSFVVLLHKLVLVGASEYIFIDRLVLGNLNVSRQPWLRGSIVNNSNGEIQWWFGF